MHLYTHDGDSNGRWETGSDHKNVIFFFFFLTLYLGEMVNVRTKKANSQFYKN